MVVLYVIVNEIRDLSWRRKMLSGRYGCFNAHCMIEQIATNTNRNEELGEERGSRKGGLGEGSERARRGLQGGPAMGWEKGSAERLGEASGEVPGESSRDRGLREWFWRGVRAGRGVQCNVSVIGVGSPFHLWQARSMQRARYQCDSE